MFLSVNLPEDLFVTVVSSVPASNPGGRSPTGWLIAALAAAPCLYLSWALFGVWSDPMARDEGSWVRFGVGLMILEFVLLHSGAFMAAMFKPEVPVNKRRWGMLGFITFYSLMAWAMAESTDSPALLWIFAGVITGRLLSGLALGKLDFHSQVSRSAFGVALYLFVVAGTIFIPIPEWGVTREVVDETYPGRGDGLWERQPHRAIAGAAVYFLIMGTAELLLFGRTRSAADGVPDITGR